MTQVLRPDLSEPVDWTRIIFDRSIFLAGSIEMDKAERWQEKFIREFDGYESLTIYNPRCENWDSTIEQSIEDTKFRSQVNWELESLVDSGIVVFYIQPGTMSPVTLMELGFTLARYSYTSRPYHIVVCCPDGFWRKGNVEIMCHRCGVPVFNNFKDLIQKVKDILG